MPQLFFDIEGCTLNLTRKSSLEGNVCQQILSQNKYLIKEKKAEERVHLKLILSEFYEIKVLLDVYNKTLT